MLLFLRQKNVKINLLRGDYKLNREIILSEAEDAKKDFLLSYDEMSWRERVVIPQNSLQLFITDECNLRCPECFYGGNLGKLQMSLEDYKSYVQKYKDYVMKIILLGGEPTLHKNLSEMIVFNAELGLKTTLYTNGFQLAKIEELMRDSEMNKWLTIRIGVHGLTVSEKKLTNVARTDIPITIVYMLARYNAHELMDATEYAEKNFNCKEFFISSIREIDMTGDYWLDTERTIPIQEYAHIVQCFVDEYRGNISILHISTRGVLVTNKQDFTSVTRCRIGSILRNGMCILSPLDIALMKSASELIFDLQSCFRYHKCVLQKIVLEKV